ncbi:probable glutathione peroxidase 8-B [Heptranchias perlo]|uniref:probable glutathione peroxidase 8-B n=1 Tax=Heptranchias perlo TaxID=212740 RepID=UPI00355A66D9
MESVSAFTLKSWTPKARIFAVFTCIVVCITALCVLQFKLFKHKNKDFYSFQVLNSRGKPVSLEKYRGKASLVVNVASNCEHTEKNYRGLQELQRELGPMHFNVLAFPCNQFGKSEPGTNSHIDSFSKTSYGVTFPIFGKIKVLGNESEPAFRYLIDTTKMEPRWNFWKYLINPKGQVIKVWRTEEPMAAIKQQVSDLVANIILKKRDEF